MMGVANKVVAKPPITQTGAHGYLLWLRRDLPPVYSAVVANFPQVANFESALQRQASGLGQDTLDTDDTDESGIFVPDPVSIDEPIMISTPFTDPVITVDAPDVPQVTIAPDASGASGAAAAGISSSTLASVANAVAAVLPAALKTATAVVNATTASKTLATAQLQYAAAVAGKSPLQTGIVTTGNGTQYLAALTAGMGADVANIGDIFSTTVAGLPLWAWFLGGVGALVLVVKTAED